MKNEQLTLTQDERKAITMLAETSPKVLDMIRSVLHSATIRKGYTQPQLVLDAMCQTDGIVHKCLEECIHFLNVELPEGYTQRSYKVDVWVETKDSIFLIDPKGIGHDHNTPISDEVKKWMLAKAQVEFSNPNKKVKFILLKPDDVNDTEFIRLQKSYQEFGIELHKTDVFLSDFIGKKTTVSDILKNKKDNLMRESLKKIVNI